MKNIKLKTISSNEEKSNRKNFTKLFKSTTIAEDEITSNLGLFLKRQEFSKMLFLNSIYQSVLKTHGVIMEFGTRWGQNLVTFNNLRGIYEPYNYNRRIIGFDTFSGFKNIDTKHDGSHEIISEGSFSVSGGYEKELENILSYHETESPLSHIKKNYIFKGDASVCLKKYLSDNPQTIISLAYFDFDIYQPTLECLKLIKPYLVKGSVICFDELNDPDFPGETVALKEVFPFEMIKIKRNIFSGIQSYFILK